MGAELPPHEHLADWLKEYWRTRQAELSSIAPAEDLRNRLDRAEECLMFLDRAWPEDQERKQHQQVKMPDEMTERQKNGGMVSGKDLPLPPPLFPTVPPTSPCSVPSSGQRIGRFEIIRPLGRGGHGIVFLAYDPQLKRHVALKLPRLDVVADQELQQRFLREAHSAAGLSHPNLVSVYEVGEVGPTCYIASEYCPGPSLATWLAANQRPVNLRMAARIVAEIAETVEYVHQSGILHRDIKPANVLLVPRCDGRTPIAGGGRQPGEQPLDFVVKLTDFGLARLAESEGDPTRTGTVAGTPAYMSPEQAAGRTSSIGPATDVYALGVILYELITGRRPFQGESDLETLRQIGEQQLVPPHRLRNGIPRDLEAICLKALEFDPRRRYATAEDLAADLRRFLAGASVRARHSGCAGRLAKWARRRPAVAALSLALLLLALGAFATVSWEWRAALANERRAEENFHLAHQAVREFHDALDAGDLYDAPELQPLRKDLMQRVLQYYQEFLQRSPGDLNVKGDLADGHYRLAHLCTILGEKQQAITLLESSLPLWEQLRCESRDGEPAYFLGKSLLLLGYLDRGETDAANALAYYQRARHIFESELRRRPGETKLAVELAFALYEIGTVHNTRKCYREALRALMASKEIREKLAGDEPDSAETELQLADSWRKIGEVQMATGDGAAALASGRRTLELVEQTLQHGPTVEGVRSLAQTLHTLGWIHMRRGEHPQAAEFFEQAQLHYEQLSRDYPMIPDYRLEMAVNLTLAARNLVGGGDREEALRKFEQARTIEEQLVREQPGSSRYASRLEKLDSELARFRNSATTRSS